MATNPILAELGALSPGAKAALASAHAATAQPLQGVGAPSTIHPPAMQAPSAIANQPQIGAPPPTPATVGQQPSMPPLPPLPAGPQVSNPPQPRGSLYGDQQELQHVASGKPALESVYSGIHNSQFGQNHPIAGRVLGALAQIPATVADVAASGIAPRIGALIPGTSANRGLKLQGLENRIGQEAKTQGEEATTKATEAEVPLRQAQTEELQQKTAEAPLELERQNKLADAQITNLLHPQAKTEFEDWRQRNPDAPTADFFKMQAETKAETRPEKTTTTKEQLQSQLIAAQNKGDTAGAKRIQQQLKDIDPMGEQRITIQQQNAATGKSKAMDAKTEKEFNRTRDKWDKDLQSYNAQNEKLSEAAQLVGSGAMGAALGSVKALSGLAGGQGSGVRITQAELNSIAHARGFKGDFDATLQQFGDGNKLTPQQVDALKGIISDVRRIAGAKQQVLNKGLDDLNDATDTMTIRKIDSQLRHALMGGVQ